MKYKKELEILEDADENAERQKELRELIEEIEVKMNIDMLVPDQVESNQEAPKKEEEQDDGGMAETPKSTSFPKEEGLVPTHFNFKENFKANMGVTFSEFGGAGLGGKSSLQLISQGGPIEELKSQASLQMNRRTLLTI